MRFLVACSLLGVVASASQAAVLFYNSTAVANNDATRNSWLADAGIVAGQNFIDFEAETVGTNLNGVNLSGLTVTHPSTNALVQSSSAFFGTSNPIGTKAMALAETSGTITLTFATPVDYIGGFDIDQPGASVKATFTDNSSAQFAIDGTGSAGDTGEFWGLWRNDALAISKVEFLATNGGDGEWGLDNVEFGAVPEPGTLLVLAAGAALAAKRRRA